MRYKDRPLFYYSPDEPTGGGEAPLVFDDPGSWDLSEAAGLPEHVDSASTAAPEGSNDPDATPESKVDTVPADDKPQNADKLQNTDKPQDTDADKVLDKKEGETDDSHLKTEGKSEDKDKAPDTAQTAAQEELDALQAACDALGITETDPAEQRKALIAARGEIAARREQEAQERKEAREKAAEDTWKKAAGDATTARVLQRMRDQGWDVDTPNCWADETWAETSDPEYGRKMATAFREEAATPEIEAFYRSTFDKSQTEYTATQQRIGEIATKYADHDAPLINQMRDSGFTPDQIEIVARSTHEHTRQVIAKTNTALTAATTEARTLREQVAGHEAALAKAREEGRSQGLTTALAEIEAGRGLPNTTGLGDSSPSALGLKGIFDDPGGFSMTETLAELSRR